MRYFLVNGVPISQENEPSSDFYSVGSWSEITAEQYNELLNPTPIEPNEFEVAKASKQHELNVWAYAFIYNGFQDTVTEHKLFTAKEDIEKYALIASSIQMLEESDLPTFQMEFGTYAGWKIETALVLKGLLSRYTKYVYPIAAKLEKLQGDINRATTIEEIEAIVI